MLAKVEEQLRAANMKVTPQRTAILRLLMASREHPGVEQLYREVRRDYPAISLATIYKTLDLFREKGVIQELTVSAHHVRYDGDLHFHPHVICQSCRKVEDLEGLNPGLPQRWLEDASTGSGYSVDNVQLFLFGTCPECKKEGARP